MKTYSLLALLAVGAIAAPSPAHIEIEIDVDTKTTHVQAQKNPFSSNAYCIPFYGHQCAAGHTTYDCCPGLNCLDDGTEVKRCLAPDDVAASRKKVAKTDDDDDICLPPWEDGHMICGIGTPKYKCCAGDYFQCKEFGRSGMYGCQPKTPSPESEVESVQMHSQDNSFAQKTNSFKTNNDDEICLPPWHIAHMFCGIGEPKYKCCDKEFFSCEKIGGPQSSHYGCLPKEDDSNEHPRTKGVKGKSWIAELL